MRPGTNRDRKAKLLVVEDDESLQLLVDRAATRAGFDVICADDGAEGLRLATEELPDVILLDVTLPNLDGRDVLRELKANPSTQAIAVIMLSARTDHLARLVGLELGAHDYLTKPFSLKILLNRLERVLWR